MMARPLPESGAPSRAAPPCPERCGSSCLHAWLVATAAAAAMGGALAQPPASAASPTLSASSIAPRARPTAAPVAREEGLRWQSLTAAQRDALAPLEHEWPTIDSGRKQKWITIAARFHALPAPEQARISQRMTEWAHLTPAERGELRMRFQQTRQVAAPDRSARWEAYQKLPPDEKQQFAARAASSSAPAASSGSKTPGTSRFATQAKANIVPNPALAQPPRPVGPMVVQASPGATTRLITRPATPPAHQQTGMPKIAATPEFVNGSTLLPRRGPQAAAVAPVAGPSAIAKGAPIVRPLAHPPLSAAPAASIPAQ